MYACVLNVFAECVSTAERISQRRDPFARLAVCELRRRMKRSIESRRNFRGVGDFPWPRKELPMFFFNSTGVEEVPVAADRYDVHNAAELVA